MLKHVSIILLLVLISACGQQPPANRDCDTANPAGLGFRAGTQSLQQFNTATCSFEDYFIQGINLGVATPGKYAGDLETAATYDDLLRWFQLMTDAHINTLRVYTLHMDFFYRALNDFNTNRQSQGLEPLWLLQGIWLDEYHPAVDLFTRSDDFNSSMKEVVDAVYGNTTLDYLGRPGKAYGVYQTDASPWLMGWLIGREVHPDEVSLTNESNLPVVSYNGLSLSLPQGTAAEVWISARMDDVLQYEKTNYGKEHAISFSSWPTLDPLSHATELGAMAYEDRESIDLANLDSSNAPAGVFFSFHAYPYYPDFISEEPDYRLYADDYGANSYLGYLAALKNHYNNRPVLIAELGVPSSWGNVHSAHSGMHHGGHDEASQGDINVRLLRNVRDTQLAGAVLFAWLDEWWKPTWLTNEYDYPFSRRAYWHNITAAEQNYGFIGFRPQQALYTSLKQHDANNWPSTSAVNAIEVGADATFFTVKIHLQNNLSTTDELLLSIDSYESSRGEKSLGAGSTLDSNQITSDIALTQGAEFLLHVFHTGSAWASQYYVGSEYDLFGLYNAEHSGSLQSPLTPSNVWNPYRWKTNYTDYSHVNYLSFYAQNTNVTFDIGKLGVCTENCPTLSTDAIFLSDTLIQVRIPWGLLQFSDPAQHKVFHDDPATTDGWQDPYTTDGIALGVIYNGELIGETERFLWNKWFSNPYANPQDEPIPAYEEYLKQSYVRFQQAMQP